MAIDPVRLFYVGIFKLPIDLVLSKYVSISKGDTHIYKSVGHPDMGDTHTFKITDI